MHFKKNSLIRKTLSGIMFLGISFSTFGAGSLPSAHAQVETPYTPILKTSSGVIAPFQMVENYFATFEEAIEASLTEYEENTDLPFSLSIAASTATDERGYAKVLPEWGDIPIEEHEEFKLLLMAQNTANGWYAIAPELVSNETYNNLLYSFPDSMLDEFDKGYYYQYDIVEVAAQAVSGHKLPWENGRTAILMRHEGSGHVDQIDFDISAQAGTWHSNSGYVYASKPGTVVYVKEISPNPSAPTCPDSNYWRTANVVVIRHSDTEYSWYYHLAQDSVIVNEGDSVNYGTRIAQEGRTGCTGGTTGIHLHFMISTSIPSFPSRTDPNVAPWPPGGSITTVDFQEVAWSNLVNGSTYTSQNTAGGGGGNPGGGGTGQDCGQVSYAGVVLYEHATCNKDTGGRTKAFSSSTGWSDIVSDFNDITSSIYVASGWSVKVFEKSTGEGGGSWRCVAGSMWDLNVDYYTNGDTGRRINDDISSVQVYNNSNCYSGPPPADHSVQFYRGWHYEQGICYGDVAGSYINIDGCSGYDNAISSLILKSGWSVRIYKERDLGGTSKCYTSNDDDFSNDSFDDGTAVNDQLSSFALYNQSSCPTTGDSYEPDNSSGVSKWISSGTPQTHSIIPASDQDWTKFQLNSTSAITLETSGSTGADTRMWLYDSALNEIEYDDDDSSSGNYSLIDRQCGVDSLPAGTYYVKVDEYNNDNEISSYDISYNIAGTCATAPSAPTLNNPSNNATINRTDSVVLSWNTASGATQYYAELWGGPGNNLNSGWISNTSWNLGSQWGGVYQWRVKSRNSSLVESTWSETRTLTIRYGNPSNLSATPSGTQINLSWNASADGPGNIDGYRIYRGGTSIAIVGNSTTTYQNSGLTCGTTYSYTVRAYKGSLESGDSNTVSSTPSGCPPSMPSSPSINAATQTSLTLNWQDNSNNEIGFKIYRWQWDETQSANAFLYLATVSANITSYTQTGLICGSNFNYYEVSAYNANGESSLTGWVQGTTLDCPIPTAPSNLVAIGGSQPSLTWTNNYTGDYHFHIERSLDSSTWEELPSTSNSAYTDTQAECSILYYYRVRTHNYTFDTFSDYSNVASATTTSCTIPSNDDFNSSTLIGTIPYNISQDTRGATIAVDDPELTTCNRLAGQASVWYRYSPVTTGKFQIDTRGSNYDTMLAIWRGARGSLIPIGCNDDIGTVNGVWDADSTLILSLSAGTTYYIEASTFNGYIDVNGLEALSQSVKPIPEVTSLSGGLLNLHISKSYQIFLPLLLR